MRIKRAIIVPAIVTLGTAGSVLATSAVPLMATQASSVSAMTAMPTYFYHG